MKPLRPKLAFFLVLLLLLQSAQAAFGSHCTQVSHAADAHEADAVFTMAMTEQHAHAMHDGHKAAEATDTKSKNCSQSCECAGHCDQISQLSLLPTSLMQSHALARSADFASETSNPLLAHSNPPIRPPDTLQTM